MPNVDLYSGVGDNAANYEEDYERRNSNETSSPKGNAKGGKDGEKLAKAMNRKAPQRGYCGRG